MLISCQKIKLKKIETTVTFIHLFWICLLEYTIVYLSCQYSIEGVVTKTSLDLNVGNTYRNGLTLSSSSICNEIRTHDLSILSRVCY